MTRQNKIREEFRQQIFGSGLADFGLFAPMPAQPLSELQALSDYLGKGMHKVSVQMIRRFPMGLWTCRDGRQVLFDRAYQPIWQYRRCRVKTISPSEYVECIAQEKIFFEGLQPWYRQYSGMKELRAVLVNWRCIKQRRK